MVNNKKILIASAWPYANGSLHLGHLAALLGADTLARYFRLKGADVLFVSGSDCHGTPISVAAKKAGVEPGEIAQKYHDEFTKNFEQLGFSYDNYSNTMKESHAKVVQDLFLQLKEKGFIYTKVDNLPYCEDCDRFLPDRYIEGECPKCGFAHARGDQCDECGSLLDPEDLINPICKECGKAPIWKESEHFYLALSKLEKKLKKFVKKNNGSWRANAVKFTENLLEQGLHDRAITRDTKWGVDIPIEGYEDKKIYVWFEAVSGYLSASMEKDEQWAEFWQNDDAYHYYVHGKDNIPFHTVIWPAILIAHGGFNLPNQIVSSEYLTLENKQFSTSRNHAVWLPDFLKEFDADTLRYYLTINGPENSDADFSWKQFQTRVNSELIATFGNFFLRTFSMVKKNFPDGVELPAKLDSQSQEFLGKVESAFDTVGDAIEKGEFQRAIKLIFTLADECNKYFQVKTPWVQLKEDESAAKDTLAVAAQACRALAILIEPFLPRVFEKVAESLDGELLERAWQYPVPTLVKVVEAKGLFDKIEDDIVDAKLAVLNN